MTETVELAVIPRNVTYLAKPRTGNLAGFRDFVLASPKSGAPGPKASKVESELFDLGNKAAGLWSKYGEDKRTGDCAPTVPFLDYVIVTTGIDSEKWSEKGRAAFAAGVASHSLYRSYQVEKNRPAEAVSVSK